MLIVRITDIWAGVSPTELPRQICQQARLRNDDWSIGSFKTCSAVQVEAKEYVPTMSDNMPLPVAKKTRRAVPAVRKTRGTTSEGGAGPSEVGFPHCRTCACTPIKNRPVSYARKCIFLSLCLEGHPAFLLERAAESAYYLSLQYWLQLCTSLSHPLFEALAKHSRASALWRYMS